MFDDDRIVFKQWQHLYQTLDNTLIYYALLYNITQHRYTTFPNVFADSHLVVWVVDSKNVGRWSMGGRNKGNRPPLKVLCNNTLHYSGGRVVEIF